MDWNYFKEKRCHCGRPATREIGGILFCGRHKKLVAEVVKRGRFSGKSKSDNAFGKY